MYARIFALTHELFSLLIVENLMLVVLGTGAEVIKEIVAVVVKVAVVDVVVAVVQQQHK